MCSLSWIRSDKSVQLFFNRDEYYSRAAASLPVMLENGHVQALMPIDPVGGGSWMCVNNHGLAIFLLNNYEISTLNDQKYRSRGLLVKSLGLSGTLEQVVQNIKSEDFPQYAPLTLCAFDCHKEYIWGWDGAVLRKQNPDGFIASSSLRPKEVIAERKALFDAARSNPDQLRRLHTLHSDDPEVGFCVHREGAGTRNYSEITLTTKQVTLDHAAGAPCETALLSYHLKRVA